MKKLITICLIMASAFAVNAQDLNFEETVNYINKIISENEKTNYFIGSSNNGEQVLGILASKNGKVTIYDHWINDYTWTDEYKKPIGFFNLFDLEKCGIEEGDYITLLDKNSQKLGMFSNFTPTYLSRIEKAFKHLRSLCIKEKDPFGE